MKKKQAQNEVDSDFSQRTVVIMLIIFIIVSLISLLVFLQVLERTKMAGAASQRAASAVSFSDGELSGREPSRGKVMLEIRPPAEETTQYFEVERR